MPTYRHLHSTNYNYTFENRQAIDNQRIAQDKNHPPRNRLYEIEIITTHFTHL